MKLPILLTTLLSTACGQSYASIPCDNAEIFSILNSVIELRSFSKDEVEKITNTKLEPISNCFTLNSPWYYYQQQEKLHKYFRCTELTVPKRSVRRKGAFAVDLQPSVRIQREDVFRRFKNFPEFHGSAEIAGLRTPSSDHAEFYEYVVSGSRVRFFFPSPTAPNSDQVTLIVIDRLSS